MWYNRIKSKVKFYINEEEIFNMDVLKFGKVVLELRNTMDASETLRKSIKAGEVKADKSLVDRLEKIDYDIKSSINELTKSLTGGDDVLFDIGGASIVSSEVVAEDKTRPWSDDDLVASVDNLHKRSTPLWQVDGYSNEGDWIKDKLMETIDSDGDEFYDINTPDEEELEYDENIEASGNVEDEDLVLEDEDIVNETVQGSVTDFVKEVASTNVDVQLPEINLD